MYYLYKQGTIPKVPVFDRKVITIKKQIPNPLVKNMHSMQMGRKDYLYFMVMTFLVRGFSRVFIEYDIIVDNEVVSKAVLISKVPKYKFLPAKGVHLCFCETIEKARGNGYYPLLLSFIQNDNPQMELYMIVDENNNSSIRGIEKAGFVKYANGLKLPNGQIVEI